MHDSTKSLSTNNSSTAATTSAKTLLTLPLKQPYRINNCKFQNSIINFLSELHSTKAYTDVVLCTAEGKALNAHRVVLAAGSSYFNNVFKTVSPQNPQQNLVVALPSVKFKDLDRVVKFIYLGYLDIINSELEGFVNLAKKLGVVGMSDDDDEQEQDEEVHDNEKSPQPPPPITLPDEEELAPPPSTSQQQQADEDGDELENIQLVAPYDDEQNYVDEEDHHQHYQGNNDNDDHAPSLSPQPPTLPNEFLQVSYTDNENDENDDEEEDLAGYALDDEMMMDEDDENSDQNSGLVRRQNARLFGSGGAGSGSVGEKPFLCVKCGKTYNSNKSLWRHKKFTCDEKIDFKCTVCGKVFSRSDNLRRHVVVAHS